jgi:hypothetical protein
VSDVLAKSAYVCNEIVLLIEHNLTHVHFMQLSGVLTLPFNAGIKSLRATLHDEIFYWRFCFLNGVFHKYMREKPTNATMIHSVY